MSEGLIQRVLVNLRDRRQRILKGGINCIPSPFKNFRNDFPGIEQGKYYLISGASKSGKSQLTSYLFLYTPILYAYYNPQKIRLKIFYFPLEETPEKITMRFMCHLLYFLSNGDIRISPLKLQSINKENVVEPEILEILNSIEYRSVLDFFEEHVHFITERNPTGCWKVINRYAQEAGTIHKKTILIENKETGVKQEREVFDYYEPKDPDEYVEIIYDHCSILECERGMGLKECIDKLSEYFMVFRNHFNYTPVMVQQQNDNTISLEAFKANKIRPNLSGLADSKNTGKDCSVMIGITNPYAFEMPQYLRYDITKLRGYARFMEIVLNREGESNGVLGLYFDGATNYFAPLPKYDNIAELNKVHQLIQRNQESTSK